MFDLPICGRDYNVVCTAFPEPYTTYTVYVRGVVSGQETNDSVHIVSKTDVDSPGVPAIANVSCYDTGTIFMQWERPKTFHKSVDFYKIYFGRADYRPLDSITVPANTTERFPQVRTQTLSGVYRLYVITRLV